jgi:hypothetical protein
MTVILVAELPTVAGFGETAQVASEGAPVQVKATVPDNPSSPPTLNVYPAGWPGATVAEVGEPEGGANEKSWPVPLSATAWGLPGALSLNERLPDAAPAVDGVNVTATVQVAAAPTGFEVEQVVPEAAMAKGPVTAIAVKVRLPFPVLVRVTVWELLVVPTNWGEKVNGADKLTTGAVPVPLKLTICGLLLALSVNVRLPERLPLAVGVNVTLITQLLLAATGAPVMQVVPLPTTAKSPVAAMLVKVKDAVPLLLTVTALAALVVSTC